MILATKMYLSKLMHKHSGYLSGHRGGWWVPCGGGTKQAVFNYHIKGNQKFWQKHVLYVLEYSRSRKFKFCFTTFQITNVNVSGEAGELLDLWQIWRSPVGLSSYRCLHSHNWV